MKKALVISAEPHKGSEVVVEPFAGQDENESFADFIDYAQKMNLEIYLSHHSDYEKTIVSNIKRQNT